MPAKGQHRKSRSMTRLTRICIAAGTGGVALALPLIGAGVASAQDAPAKAPAAVSHTAAKATGVVKHSAAPTKTAKAAKAAKYKVVSGDSLSKIADTHHVDGGWHQLYTDNKSTVGANPDLIFPGQHLTLNGASAEKPAATTHHSAAAKKAAPAPTTAKKAAPKPTTAAPKPAAKSADTTKSTTSAAKTSDSGYTKPVGDAAIGTQYHASGSNWSSGYHTGVDFLVGTGTSVKSVAAGTVVSAGSDGAYGNDVIIQHSDGKYTLYGHLSQVLVSAGQSVTEGQQIGISGATGNVTGPHLHFEVRTTPSYGSDIDPVAYLRSHGVSI